MVVCQDNLSKIGLFTWKYIACAVENSVETVKSFPCFTKIRFLRTSYAIFS